MMASRSRLARLMQTLLLVPRVRRALGRRVPRSMRRVQLADAVLVALVLGIALPMVLVGALQGRVKAAFDPLGVLNPGRMEDAA